jgi:NhaP-type Na+/H+ or K+/H+ antiporter
MALYGMFLQATVSPISVLIAISLIIIIGYIARAIFNKTKVPEVLILIFIGLLLVPIGHFLPDSYILVLRSLAAVFGAFALIIIMYGGGRKIALHAKSLRNFKGISLGMLDTIIPTFALAFVMNWLFGWPLIYGAILGAVLGETSITVIIPIIRRLKMPEDVYETVVMETTLNSVISILIFTVLLTVAQGQVVDGASLANYVVDYLSVALFMGLIAGVAWLFVQSRIRGAREYLAVTAVAILLYGVVSAFNGAAIVSVLIFAVMMGNYKAISKLLRLKIDISRKEAHTETVVGKDLEFLIRTFFFVFIGMIALLTYQYLWYALVATLALIAVRAFETKLVMWKAKEHQMLIFSLMQRGTVVAVLGAILYALGGSYFNQIFYIAFMVIITTNIIGSLLVGILRYEIRKE